MSKVKIGLICGSGLDNPDIIQNRKEKRVMTPYGEPSDALITGVIGGVECVLLSRHGRKHTIMPSKVNYRANIWALKEENVTHLIVTTACGSLQEHIKPGDLVLLDQFIDRTTKRHQSFYDGELKSPPGVCHIPMATPFCNKTGLIILETAKKLGISIHKTGTCVTIEGPRFSTRAESRMFKAWGGELINMTTVPEAVLANEAGIAYSAVGMATDYDSWKDEEEAVSVDAVLETFKKNATKVMELIVAAVPKVAATDFSKDIENRKAVVKGAVMLPSQH